MKISFDGKRALITGAGKGAGRGLAVELTKCGAHVVALSRTAADLESLKQEYPDIETICCDLGNWEATRTSLENIEPVHLLINNAAMASGCPFLETPESQFDQFVATNMKGVLNVTQVVIKKMVENNIAGSIVNVSSTVSMFGCKQYYVYSATKAALDQSTRVLAAEFGEKGIRVNSVNPTIILTEMAMEIQEAGGQQPWFMSRTPLKRFCTVEEVVNPIMFLLSDKASMISGVCLPIDGGFLAA